MRKRISMAGADVAVTDERVADLALEYAMQLGRAGTTEVVRLPVARNGRAEEADLLLGPASQIALTWNDDDVLEAVELPGVDDVVATLQHRIEGLTGTRDHGMVSEDESDRPVFIDFDDFSG